MVCFSVFVFLHNSCKTNSAYFIKSIEHRPLLHEISAASARNLCKNKTLECRGGRGGSAHFSHGTALYFNEDDKRDKNVIMRNKTFINIILHFQSYRIKNSR